MNKLQTVAGKYIINKENTGNFFGGMLNKFVVTGISKIIEPQVQFLSEGFEDQIMMSMDPEEKKALKNKGYSDEEIKNYALNKATKEGKDAIRSKLTEIIGSTGTTKEYTESKDRGFIEKALYGVAES